MGDAWNSTFPCQALKITTLYLEKETPLCFSHQETLSCLWGTCYHFQTSQEYVFPSVEGTVVGSLFSRGISTQNAQGSTYIQDITLLFHQIHLWLANDSKIIRKYMGKEQKGPCFSPGNQLEMDAVTYANILLCVWQFSLDLNCWTESLSNCIVKQMIAEA